MLSKLSVLLLFIAVWFHVKTKRVYYERILYCAAPHSEILVNSTSNSTYTFNSTEVKVCTCVFKCDTEVIVQNGDNLEAGCQESLGTCSCPVHGYDGYTCTLSFEEKEPFMCYGIDFLDPEVCGGPSMGVCVDQDTCQCHLQNTIFPSWMGSFLDTPECENLAWYYFWYVIENYQMVILAAVFFFLFALVALILYCCYVNTSTKNIENAVKEITDERQEMKDCLEDFIMLKNAFIFYSQKKKKILKKELSRQVDMQVKDKKVVKMVKELIEKERFVLVELPKKLFKGKAMVVKKFKDFNKFKRIILKTEASIKQMESLMFYQNVEKFYLYSFVDNLFGILFDVLFFRSETLEVLLKRSKRSKKKAVSLFDSMTDKGLEMEQMESPIVDKELINDYKSIFTALWIIIEELQGHRKDGKYLDYIATRFMNQMNEQVDLEVSMMNTYLKGIKTLDNDKNIDKNEFKTYQQSIGEMIKFKKKFKKLSDVVIMKKIKEFKKFFESSFGELEYRKKEKRKFFVKDKKNEKDEVAIYEMISNSRRMVSTLFRNREEVSQKKAEELIDKIKQHVEENSDSDTHFYCKEFMDHIIENFFFIDTPLLLLKKMREVLETILKKEESNEGMVILPVLKCLHEVLCCSFFQQKTEEILMSKQDKEKLFELISEFSEKFNSNHFVQIEISYVIEILKILGDVGSLAEDIIGAANMCDWSDLLKLILKRVKQIPKKISTFNPNGWYKRYIPFKLKFLLGLLQESELQVKLRGDIKNNQEIKLFYLELLGKKCSDLFNQHCFLRNIFRKLVTKRLIDSESDRNPYFSMLPQLIPGCRLISLVEKVIAVAEGIEITEEEEKKIDENENLPYTFTEGSTLSDQSLDEIDSDDETDTDHDEDELDISLDQVENVLKRKGSLRDLLVSRKKDVSMHTEVIDIIPKAKAFSTSEEIVIDDKQKEGKRKVAFEASDFSKMRELFKYMSKFLKESEINIKDKKEKKSALLFNGSIHDNLDEREYMSFCKVTNMVVLCEFMFYWNTIQDFINNKKSSLSVVLKGIEVCGSVLKTVGQKSNDWKFIVKNFRYMKKNVFSFGKQNITQNDLQMQVEKAILAANKFYSFSKYVRDVICHIQFLELEISLVDKVLSSFYHRGRTRNQLLNIEQVYSLLEDDNHKLVCVIGQGGIGKTCSVRNYCHYLMEVAEHHSYPLFIKADILSQFQNEWKNDTTLEKKVEVIVESVIQSHYSELNEEFSSTEINELKFEIKEIVKNERCCIVLDGVDEVAEVKRTGFFTLLTMLLKESELDFDKFLITTRFIEEMEEETCVLHYNNCTQLEVQPLNQGETLKMVENILFQGEHDQNKILERFKKTTKIIKITGNPLISTLILKRLLSCEEKDDDNLQSKYDLYEHILFDSINQDKKKKDYPDNSSANCSTFALMNFFSAIAYVLHRSQQHQKQYLINILNRRLEMFVDNEKWILELRNPLETTIDSLISFSSLLQSQKNFILFTHRSIQEFFAARFVINPEKNVNMQSLLHDFNEMDTLYFSYYFEDSLGRKNTSSAGNMWESIYEFCDLFFCLPFSDLENLLFYKSLCDYFLNKLHYPAHAFYFFKRLKVKNIFGNAIKHDLEALNMMKELNKIPKSKEKAVHEIDLFLQKCAQNDYNKLENDDYLCEFRFERHLFDGFIWLKKFYKHKNYHKMFKRLRKLLVLFEKYKRITMNMPKYYSIHNEFKSNIRKEFLRYFQESSKVIKFINFMIKSLEFHNYSIITVTERKEIMENLMDVLYHDLEIEIEEIFAPCFNSVIDKILHSSSKHHSKVDVFNTFLSHLMFNNYDVERTTKYFYGEKVFLNFHQTFSKNKVQFKIQGLLKVLSFDPKKKILHVLNHDHFFEIKDYKKSQNDQEILPGVYELCENMIDKQVVDDFLKLPVLHTKDDPMDLLNVLKCFRMKYSSNKKKKNIIDVLAYKQKILFLPENEPKRIITHTLKNGFEIFHRKVFKVSEKIMIFFCKKKEIFTCPILKDEYEEIHLFYVRLMLDKVTQTYKVPKIIHIDHVTFPVFDKNNIYNFGDTLLITEDNIIHVYHVQQGGKSEKKEGEESENENENENEKEGEGENEKEDDSEWNLVHKIDQITFSSIVLNIFPVYKCPNYIVATDLNGNYTMINFHSKEIIYNLNFNSRPLMSHFEFFFFNKSKTLFIKYFLNGEDCTYLESFKMTDDAHPILPRDVKEVEIDGHLFESGVRCKYVNDMMRDTCDFQSLKRTIIENKDDSKVKIQKISLPQSEEIDHKKYVKETYAEHIYDKEDYRYVYVSKPKAEHRKLYRKDGTLCSEFNKDNFGETKFRIKKYDHVKGKVKIIKSNIIAKEFNPNDNTFNMEGEEYFENKTFTLLKFSGYFFNSQYTGKGKLYHPFITIEELYNIFESKQKKKIIIPQLKYDGEFHLGHYDGKGTLYSENGNVLYKGAWKKGKYHQKGKIYIYKSEMERNKASYDNEIEKYFKEKKNKRNKDQEKFMKMYARKKVPQTLMKKETVNFYLGGVWKDDHTVVFYEKRSQPMFVFGKGSFVHHNLFTGVAKEYYINGNIKYEGEIFEGEYHGKGKFFHKNHKGVTLFDGIFHEDRMIEGKMYYSNGKLQYDGDFSDVSERFHGEGILYDEHEKKKYEGTFYHGKYSGTNGIVYDNNKVIYKGSFYFTGLNDTFDIDSKSQHIIIKKPKGSHPPSFLHKGVDQILSIPTSFYTKMEGSIYLKNKIKTTHSINSLIVLHGDFISIKPFIIMKRGHIYSGDHMEKIDLNNNRIYDYNGNVLYHGEISSKGVYHGKGTLYYPNSPRIKYVGHFYNGLYHGTNGKLFDHEGNEIHHGDFYNGMIEKNKRVTRIKKFKSDDEIVKLMFIKGKLKRGFWNGIGVEFYDNERLKYSGNFIDGKYSCKKGGKYYRENDGTLEYEGGFLKNEDNIPIYHGIGKLYFQNGSTIKYDGSFSHGCYNGEGIMYHSNGNKKYHGDFKYGLYDGHGTLYDINGVKEIYSGDFKNGFKVIPRLKIIEYFVKQLQLCTATNVSSKNQKQKLRRCKTCEIKHSLKMDETNVHKMNGLLCETCAFKCHEGHELYEDIFLEMERCRCCKYGKERKSVCKIEHDLYHSEMFPKDNTIMLQKVFKKKICTFAITGRNKVKQSIWKCNTCINNHEIHKAKVICFVCKDICHKGHDVIEVVRKSKKGFCDCLLENKCKCYRKVFSVNWEKEESQDEIVFQKTSLIKKDVE